MARYQGETPSPAHIPHPMPERHQGRVLASGVPHRWVTRGARNGIRASPVWQPPRPLLIGPPSRTWDTRACLRARGAGQGRQASPRAILSLPISFLRPAGEGPQAVLEDMGQLRPREGGRQHVASPTHPRFPGPEHFTQQLLHKGPARGAEATGQPTSQARPPVAS